MNVEESQVVNEWLDQGRQQERSKALAVVREQLMDLLQTRFPGPLPSEMAAAINAQTEYDAINRWFKKTLKARTLDEVRAAFGVPVAAPRKTPKRRR